MTLEELLRRAYGAAMTPLPRLPETDVGRLGAWLESQLPSVPGLPEQLPQMPEAWRRYALERGLYPEQRGQSVGSLERLQAGQR